MFKKLGVSGDKVFLATTLSCFLVLIVVLFMMQWKYLESARIECESQGGIWHSSSTGKVTITRCNGD